MNTARSTWDKKRIAARGLEMAYVEAGAGDPIVFLHGNPTSSYLWRNVMPHVGGRGRCIAPDLIGMGDSDKLPDPGPNRYRLAEHIDFVEDLLSELGVRERVTLVAHDWGGPIAFDWARRHPNAVKGIAYMETIVTPLTWDDWPPPSQELFQGFRGENGETLILERNMFVEQVLPGAVIRDFSDAEMAEYRRPFATAGEDRRPTLSWPREIPIEGSPADVAALVAANQAFMETSQIPKLFVDAKPGAIVRGRVREICRAWPNQTEITVPGIHFIQEDSPEEIGTAIATWLDGIVIALLAHAELRGRQSRPDVDKRLSVGIRRECSESLRASCWLSAWRPTAAFRTRYSQPSNVARRLVTHKRRAKLSGRVRTGKPSAATIKPSATNSVQPKGSPKINAPPNNPTIGMPSIPMVATPVGNMRTIS
jgi:haloalkane dehalogenase